MDLEKENLARTFKRQTKIVATLGPTTSTEEEIEAVLLAGADVFRLNFSHGKHEDHQARYDIIRKLEAKYGRPICVFADLQGPKLRVGSFANSKEMLKNGDTFILDSNEDLGNNKRVHFPHPEIIKSLNVGSNLLIDDGNVRLEVTDKEEGKLITTVKVGGKISNCKGVNIPDAIVPISALTEKDKVDLEYALGMGVDWIALSFVQTPKDVIMAKQIIGDRVPVISKIEKPSALTHIDEIIEVSDAIMLARGDLGVEIPAEDVPVIQKKIISKARKAGKPIIVATQMLESMIEKPVPTRAETTDVATAVYDGADAVMLSAETANGHYPVEAVTTMRKIAKRVERDSSYMAGRKEHELTPEHSKSDAITYAAYKTTMGLNSSVIATFTVSGFTTLRISRERPPVPILSITTTPRIARRLMLAYGVHSFVFEAVDSFQKMEKEVMKIIKEYEYAEIGENVVVTASYPVKETSMTETNMMHILTIE